MLGVFGTGLLTPIQRVLVALPDVALLLPETPVSVVPSRGPDPRPSFNGYKSSFFNGGEKSLNDSAISNINIARDIHQNETVRTGLSTSKNENSSKELSTYLQSLISFGFRSLAFGSSAYVPMEGLNLGTQAYTGEDDFEVRSFWHFLIPAFYSTLPTDLRQFSVLPSRTLEVPSLLLKTPVQFASLARDSLHLEAGMC